MPGDPISKLSSQGSNYSIINRHETVTSARQFPCRIPMHNSCSFQTMRPSSGAAVRRTSTVGPFDAKGSTAVLLLLFSHYSIVVVGINGWHVVYHLCTVYISVEYNCQACGLVFHRASSMIKDKSGMCYSASKETVRYCSGSRVIG